MGVSNSSRLITSFVSTLALAQVAACSPRTEAKSPIGVTPMLDQEKQDEEEQKEEPEQVPADIVLQAERSFEGFRHSDKKLLTEEETLTLIASADAICVGERHDQVLDHYAQVRLIQGMDERQEMRGFQLGLGLEMVRHKHQEQLRGYATGRLDQTQFEQETSWNTEWGFPLQYYLPQIDSAVDADGTLLALGVTRTVTQAVAKKGIDGLSEEQRERLPELDLDDEQHRELFDSLMSGHPNQESDSFDNYYQAQVIWDEAMAHRAADWLEDEQPSRKLVILAGRAHCHRSGIPSRLERRTGLRVLSVLPQDTGAPLSVEGPDSLVTAGYDFQMVFKK